MKKKLIVAAAFSLVFSFAFAACEKELKSEYGVVIKDKDGITHVIMTNEAGETLLDDKGNLIEVVIGNDDKPVTHSDGAVETSSITYPNLVTNKDSVALPGLSMAVPNEWKSKSTVYISLEHKKVEESGATLSVKEDHGSKDLAEAASEQYALAEANTDSKLDINVEQLTIAGTNMYKRTLYNSSSDSYLIRYSFSHSGKVYLADCTVNGSYYNQIDFDAIMNQITFK